MTKEEIKAFEKLCHLRKEFKQLKKQRDTLAAALQALNVYAIERIHEYELDDIAEEVVEALELLKS